MMKKEAKCCGKKKNGHWSKRFIFWNSSPLVEEKFYLITCPLNTLAIFSPMLYNDPKVIKCQVGQHMQCGERFHFWPTSFSLVYTHTPPYPFSRKNQMVLDESLCHLEHVFCHESQIKELVPLLCCHVVLIK
jgi:hypothetical protein